MKRWLGLMMAGATVVLVSAFTIPGEKEQRKAIGSLFHLTPELKETFTPGDDFEALPRPGWSDWLATHEEPGQTYAQFLRSNPERAGEKGRKFIYLQPIGVFPDDAPAMKTLKGYLEAFFHPVPVKVAKPLLLASLPRIKTRGDQINCTDVLDLLQERVPRDACVLMAVTMKDLYPGPGWNFVFGMARLSKRCGVFSFARYGLDEDRKRALLRALKVISHETGHVFGIKHCVHFHCLMNGSNGMAETDRAPLHFCPVCLRKLHWSLRFPPVERYQRLSTYLKDNGLPGESAWFERRIEVISR